MEKCVIHLNLHQAININLCILLPGIVLDYTGHLQDNSKI